MSELITRYFEEGKQNCQLAKQTWAEIKFYVFPSAFLTVPLGLDCGNFVRI